MRLTKVEYLAIDGSVVSIEANADLPNDVTATDSAPIRFFVQGGRR